MKHKLATIFIATIKNLRCFKKIKDFIAKINLFIIFPTKLNLQTESSHSVNLLSPLRSTDKIALGYWYDVFFSENMLRKVRELPEDRVNGEEHLSKYSTELSS